MNVLSLFDGMSCGQIALNRIGIKPEKYYASELDKYAIKVTQANYPDTIQLGDVTKWREWDIDWSSIDLLIGGSPCQGFSFAGKQLAFDDPRSKLFFVYVDILNHIKSVNPGIKFMLENVKMKREYLDIINEILGTEFTMINSNLVSAQSRPRCYWASWSFNQPKDKGILLSDITQDDACSSYAVSDAVLSRIDRKQYSKPKVYPDKTGTLNTKNNSGQMSCDSGTTFIWFIGRGNNPSGQRALDGKAPCLTSSSWQWNNYLELSGMVRRVTEIEAERLQTVPDNYTDCVSSAQRYKMLGNGWTVDVIAHIFKDGLL